MSATRDDISTEASEPWREPVRGGYPHPSVMGLPGLERLRRFRLGDSPGPPLTRLTGAAPSSFSEGNAEARMPASPWLRNSAGLIGGGTLAILADIAFGCAVETKMAPAIPYTTAELSLSFVRPAHAGGILTCAGQAIHVGGSIALSEVFVLDDNECLIAHGTSRLAVMPPMEEVPAPPDDPHPSDPLEYDTPDPYLREPAPGAVVAQETWSELPGGTVLGKLIKGDLDRPPISYLTGMRLIGAGGGGAIMTMPASEWLSSPARRLQGGTIAMLADSAMQAAVVSTAPPATAVAGLDLKVNFLRPGIADGRDLTARAEVMHSGRTLAITRCEVANADGKPIVLATGSSMFLPGRPASLGDVEFPEPLDDGT